MLVIKCSDECIPCCDFCIHCIHDEYDNNGETIIGGPIGCDLWDDEEHQELAIACAYCPDFICFKAKRERVYE